MRVRGSDVENEKRIRESCHLPLLTPHWRSKKQRTRNSHQKKKKRRLKINEIFLLGGVSQLAKTQKK